MGLLDAVVGGVKGYVFSGGNPAAAIAGAAAEDQKAKEKKKLQRRFAEQQAQEAEFMAMDFGGSSSRPTFVDPYADQLVVNRGLGLSLIHI